ncbi:MAG: tRNA pseudouridine(38-40) synthase TruA [Holosporales bacterium]|jgi:tRNA pseudouridine38-40 synthase|nr:tRNA pseudouridine(38-40) synthase TruA [Holosporales bacterium]
MRVRLDIEYDGMMFSGWQRQEGGIITVQETIESALYKVFGGLNSVVLYGAGRTDAGVHAINQVAHFEANFENFIKRWGQNIGKLALAINFYLHDSGCVIKNSSIVPNDFHARFSAKQRQYVYIISNQHSDSVLFKNRAWCVRKPLDIELMNEAAKFFVGEHNFNAFRSSQCQARSAIRTIDSIAVVSNKNLIYIEVAAKSFLHNQVRIIVGTLKEIGARRMDKNIVKALLEDKSPPDRRKSGPTAPAFGLYFKNVIYP